MPAILLAVAVVSVCSLWAARQMGGEDTDALSE